MTDRTDLPPRALADLVVDAASDKKAEDILVLNVSEVTTIADLFVICSGRGERQVQAIADAVWRHIEAHDLYHGEERSSRTS